MRRNCAGSWFSRSEKSTIPNSGEPPFNILIIIPAVYWPGNIRELRNIVTRAVILTRGNGIRIDDLNSSFRVFQSSTAKEDSLMIPYDFAEMTKLQKAAADKARWEVEKQFVQNLLNKHNGNVSEAARQME